MHEERLPLSIHSALTSPSFFPLIIPCSSRSFGGSKVRRGARWALGVGAALIAMAAVSGARADVRSIDLDECSASCVPAAIDDAAAAEDESAADITLSLFGGADQGCERPSRSDLRPKGVAAGPGQRIAVPNRVRRRAGLRGSRRLALCLFRGRHRHSASIDARTGLGAASIHLFTPSTIGRLTLTDVLSDSNELFKPLPRPAM